VAEITDENVVALLPLLEEAARAQQSTVERFVPPRTGIVEQVAARRHQFVLGRRGVGKTTLLRTVEHHSSEAETAIAFVDLENLRGIPYPDVLIHLLVHLLRALRRALKSLGSSQSLLKRGPYRKAERSLKSLERQLSQLLMNRSK
jgi:ABC-type branched-subunit amino acid transport system ATPase component